MISKGFNNKNIARAFDVSESTIKSHVQNLLRKFNVRSRPLSISSMTALNVGGGDQRCKCFWLCLGK
ncbi:response regulator transcription factor [Pseudomonas sp. BIOMIG1BAC]|uniref:response regulator transcription factor n=1 Tax=Pseudomonas sp. BIOMIG1BAC TaxID=1758730 RepID=UPI0013E1AA36|nr:response regulator transcription factor [Pseudomonas sp. BIOMIG1BAC]